MLNPLSRGIIRSGRRALSQVVDKADYVIVGGGSAGCVMANRLSEDGKASVILLEAGGRDTGRISSLFVQMPTALSIPMSIPDLNWAFNVDPAPMLDDRVISCPRGRLLGGSSSINGMVYVRGNRGDFDAWEELGATGWGYNNVLPYFRRAETWQLGADTYRGGSGPLHVKLGDNPSGTPLNAAFIAAGVEAGYAAPNDYNAASQEGFIKMAMTVFHSGPNKGKRCSAASSYLAEACRRPNVTVRTRAMASRIRFDGSGDEPRADAVEFISGDGTGGTIEARKEVIVCAGAIQSPQLLQVSGVGDPSHLASINVPLVASSKLVGENLQDHHELYFQQECLEPVSLAPVITSPWRRAMVGARWLAMHDGLGASNHFEAGAFVRSGPWADYPDVQFHFLPVAVSYDGRSVAQSPSGHSFQVHVGTLRSPSRGFVRAETGDIRMPPQIRPNAMSTMEDWRDLRQGIRIARDAIRSPALRGLAGRELAPGDAVQSDDDLDRFIRRHLESAYHVCGTCRMDDNGGVVDSAGRVRGVQGLRVADASIMPRVTAGNLNAPVIMLAEKLADAVRDRCLPPTVLVG